MKNFKLFTILILSILFFHLREVNAAQIFLEPRIVEIQAGEHFLIDVFLDTENALPAGRQENINALEGRISFPKNLLKLELINSNDSFVKFWIQEPELKKGKIVFSGIVPNGFTGNGKIFSIIFRGKYLFDSGKRIEGRMKIEEARVLSNDGKGTAMELSLGDSSVTIEYPFKPFYRGSLFWIIIFFIPLVFYFIYHRIKGNFKR